MLVLPDAGGVQIKLTPMERTLYILFLRYPDGINADELWRYWDELCDIYGSQTVYDDMDMIEDAVEGICDEEKVSWYTNVSRIKRFAFKACLRVHGRRPQCSNRQCKSPPSSVRILSEGR